MAKWDFLSGFAGAFLPAYQQSGQNFMAQQEQIRREQAAAAAAQQERLYKETQLDEQRAYEGEQLQGTRAYEAEQAEIDRALKLKALESGQQHDLGMLERGAALNQETAGVKLAQEEEAKRQQALIDLAQDEEQRARMLTEASQDPQLAGLIEAAPTPEDAFKMMAEFNQPPEAVKPVAVGAGSTLVNPETGEQIFQAPASAAGINKPAELAMLEAMGLPPTLESLEKVREAGRAPSATEVKTPDYFRQVEQAKAEGKSTAAAALTLPDEISQAEEMQRSLDRLGALSERAPSGLVGETLSGIEGMIGGQGIPGIDTPAAQEFEALAAQFTLENAAELKGSLSDKDVQFLNNMGASLRQNPEARGKIIAEAKAAIGRGMAKMRKQLEGVRGGKTAAEAKESQAGGDDPLGLF
jgi:hypothetical protein